MNAPLNPAGQQPRSLLEYRGKLTSEIRIQLLDLLQSTSRADLGLRTDLKGLIGIALELLDNAQRYNLCQTVDFRWQIAGDELQISIRNKASRHDGQRLSEAVNAIAAMSTEQVCEAFRRQLTNEAFGLRGGAGLGMLQIARRSGRKIQATVEPIEDMTICTSIVSTQLPPQ